MKTPPHIDQLSLAGADIGTGGTYPSLGFQPVWDADLGNGDYYGLYWPYGREKQEPIVCDMLHDEWRLQVAFSNTEIFIKWLALNDGQRGDHDVEDSGLVGRRFLETKPLLKNNLEEAISRLNAICDDFPECAEYWYTLATQLRRVGNRQSACLAAIRAFTSNWAFGTPPEGTLKLIESGQGLVEDPLVTRIGMLTTKYGGSKENRNYDILKEIISAYLSSPTPVLGLVLNQNYGYMMSSETVSFQERYNFDSAIWLDEQSQLCAKILGDSRRHLT